MTNKRTKVLALLLGISVLVNLLVIGSIIGFKYKSHRARPFPIHSGWITRHLDEDKRQQLKPVVRAHVMKTRPLRKEMRKARKALEAAILSEPMDLEKAAAAARTLQTLTVEVQTSMHEHMIKIMSELSPEERKRALKFTHSGRGGRGGPGGPGGHRRDG